MKNPTLQPHFQFNFHHIKQQLLNHLHAFGQNAIANRDAQAQQAAQWQRYVQEHPDVLDDPQMLPQRGFWRPMRILAALIMLILAVYVLWLANAAVHDNQAPITAAMLQKPNAK